MKKHVLKIFNKKKLGLVLLAFVALGSMQLNAQTELTVTDAVEVQLFEVGKNDDLDVSILDITGTGGKADNNNFIGVLSDAIGDAEPYTSTDDVQGTFTFTVRSTAADITSDITLKFAKRNGNSVAGTVEIDGTEVQTFSAASDGSPNQSLSNIDDVVLTNVALSTTPKTIVVKLNSLLRASQTSSQAPTFRFDKVSIDKTAVVGAPTNNTYTSIDGANGAGLNWHDPASWVGGVVPSESTDNVIVNAGLIIQDSDVVLNDVVINARITVSEGLSLTANDLAQNSQLIMKAGSSSYSSVIVNTESGDEDGLIYDRIIANNPTNDLVSSPVSGLTMDGFYQSSQNENRLYIENESSIYGERYFVGPFNNASGEYEFYTSESSNNAGDNDNDVEFLSGKGYRMATKAGETGTVRFSGAIQKDAVSIDITDGGDATYGQWNLIGNPYSSYLDFDTFWTANSAQFEAGANKAIYGWNGSGYTAWNSLSGAKIAPGQGFFVKTTASTTGTVTFTPAMRVTGNSDDFILGKSATTVNKALAKINLSNATSTYTTDIYFVDNQTRGLDSGYDAGAFAGNTDGIYTNLVEENAGVDFLIQALPYKDYNNVVVPVAINSNAGEELTISLDAASLTLPSETYVFLKDNLLNKTTLLNEGDYVFTPSTTLSGAGRFSLEFSANSVLSTEDYALNDMLIYADQASKSIVIKGILKTDLSAKVYDIQGRLVLEQKLDSSSVTNVINTSVLKTGVYVVGLDGNTKKVIIK